MKHTECKDCKLSNGDCGNHFKMDGTTNFDIASLSACDQYGNCMFFKSKANTSGDLISREALKKAFREWTGDSDTLVYAHTIYSLIDNAPTVETSKIEHKAYNDGFKDGVEQGIKLSERPQGEWELIDNSGKLHRYSCSICGHQISCVPSCLQDYKGCYCGAKMGKGGADMLQEQLKQLDMRMGVIKGDLKCLADKVNKLSSVLEDMTGKYQ